MYLYDKATSTFIIQHYNKKIPTKFILCFLKLKLTIQLLNTGFKTQLTFPSDTRHSSLTKTLSRQY